MNIEELPNEQLTELMKPRLNLTRHTGMLVAYRQESITFTGDIEGARSLLREVNGKNMLLGWWSISSIVLNPIEIVSNIRSFKKYKNQYEQYQLNPKAYIEQAKIDHVNKPNGSAWTTIIVFVVAVAFLAGVFIFLRDM